MTDAPRDRTKALLIERDQLRGEVRRLALLAEELQAHLDEALAVLYSVKGALHSVKGALPLGDEQDRVCTLIGKLEDSPETKEREPG